MIVEAATKLFMMYTNYFARKANRSHSTAQFEIHTIDFFLQETKDENPTLVCDNSYSMIWIEQGYGELTIDLQSFIIDKDTIYYVKPGQAINIEINENAVGFIISFRKEFIELFEKKSFDTVLFNQFLNMPVIKVNKDIKGFMKTIAEEMLQEYTNYLDLRFEILKGFLKIFLIYLSRQFENECQNNFQSRKMELVNTFHAELEKNFAAKKMVREYADLLAVTPNYLNDTVKEISGFTASYHIQQRVVLEAKRKAIFQGNSMKEIAYHLGFWDPAHFSKYFKNGSGTNFTDFKKGVSGFY